MVFFSQEQKNPAVMFLPHWFYQFFLYLCPLKITLNDYEEIYYHYILLYSFALLCAG